MTALSTAPTPNGTYYRFIYYPKPSQCFYISFSKRNDGRRCAAQRMQVLVYCGGLVVRRFSAKRVGHFYKRFNSIMTFAELKTYAKDMIKKELVAKKD